MANAILVLAEQLRGEVADITFEMLGAGRRLADASGAPLYAALLGSEAAPLASRLGAADKVFVADHPQLNLAPAGTVAAALKALMDQTQAGLVLLGCAPLLLLLLNTAPAKFTGAAMTAVLLIPIGLFLVVLWAVLMLLLEFFLRASVIERKGVGAALSRGWDVFSANAGRSLLMAFLLFCCGILFALLMIPLAIALLGGAVLAATVVGALSQSWAWAIGVGLLLGIPGILVMTFLGGVFKAFTSSAWTLAYLQMAGIQPGLGTEIEAAPIPEPAGGPAPEVETGVVIDGLSE